MTRPSPLQNRVRPDGEIVADPARGAWLGNRGGRIHGRDQRLTRRRWASKQWITCVLSFKNRRRELMADSYTELFFLDEVTSLAAGHRPCFECRRADALAYAEAWRLATGEDQRPRAPAMDAALHCERLGAPNRAPVDRLPDGAMISLDGGMWLLWQGALHRWSFHGYAETRAAPDGEVTVLTPARSRAVLAAGYAPQVHPSALPA